MRPVLVLTAALLAAAGISALLAQTIDGLDIQAVKQRSAEQGADAEALAEHVKDRGNAFREEARAIREAGIENMRSVATLALPKGPAGAVDFDEIVAGAASNSLVPPGEAPQLIVFASLSLPADALKSLIRDTSQAGGLIVFRGFPNNSAKEFVSRLSKVVEREDSFAHIGIDPRLFRAFDVEAVPTYVAVSSHFDLCAGFACRSQVPPFDRIVGNVTLDYALTSFAESDGPGARVAAVALANLRQPR